MTRFVQAHGLKCGFIYIKAIINTVIIQIVVSILTSLYNQNESCQGKRSTIGKARVEYHTSIM